MWPVITLLSLGSVLAVISIRNSWWNPLRASISLLSILQRVFPSSGEIYVSSSHRTRGFHRFFDLMMYGEAKDLDKKRKQIEMTSMLYPSIKTYKSTFHLTSFHLPSFAVLHSLIPARQPKLGPSKAIYYIHGGANICGRFDCIQHRSLVNGLVEHFPEYESLHIWLIDYRLCPAFSINEQVDDVVSGFEKMMDQWHYKNVIIMGDSAGGALAIRLSEHIVAQDMFSDIKIRLVALSPMVDYLNIPRKPNWSRKERSELLMTETLESLVNTYVVHNDREFAKDVSPLWRARNVQEGNTWIHPLFISFSSSEKIFEDCVDFVHLVHSRGLCPSVEVECRPGLMHIYPLFHTFSPENTRAFQRMLEYIKD